MLCNPAGPVTKSQIQKPLAVSAGVGGGVGREPQREEPLASPGQVLLPPALAQHCPARAASCLHPDGCKPAGVRPQEKHPWPRGNQSLVPWVPQVLMARVEPRGDRLPRCGVPGVPIPAPLGRGQACARPTAPRTAAKHRLPGRACGEAEIPLANWKARGGWSWGALVSHGGGSGLKPWPIWERFRRCRCLPSRPSSRAWHRAIFTQCNYWGRRWGWAAAPALTPPLVRLPWSISPPRGQVSLGWQLMGWRLPPPCV